MEVKAEEQMKKDNRCALSLSSHLQQICGRIKRKYQKYWYKQHSAKDLKVPSTTFQCSMENQQPNDCSKNRLKDDGSETSPSEKGAAFRHHLSKHCGEKLYVCSKCGKSFRRKDHLTYHLRTHSGEKLYRCSKCDKAFIHKGNLDAHFKNPYWRETI